MAKKPMLGILSHDRACPTADGGFIVSRKSHDGLLAFAKNWDGAVRAVFRPDTTPNNGLDNITVKPGHLPYDLRVLEYERETLRAELSSCSVVLTAIGFGFEWVAGLCEELGAACVYMTELTLATERQMAACECGNLLYRWRRQIWLGGQERSNVEAVKRAAGVQCNGVPTYRAYSRINENALLFYDNRVSAESLASETDLERKTADYAPLRLAFSGRLIDIKGVDDLPKVAHILAKNGLEFTLSICGDGPLRPRIGSEVSRLELASRVRLLGNMDFTSELVPFIKRSVDLFVCCHRQGDPSCTYIETMGCGVPIAGYDNEAFAGLVRESGTGWAVPMNKPDLLAREILRLAKDREALRKGARRSLEFASEHCFETTFKRRTDHLRNTLSSG